MKKIYLAIPYTGMEEHSFQIANEVSVDLLNKGYNVFSPITHSHPLAKAGKLPGDWKFWQKIDYQFIDWADEVHVIVPSKELVENSTGVQAEIEYAKKHNKPIKYLRLMDKLIGLGQINLIGFTGGMRAGKDTAAKMLNTHEHGYIIRRFASAIKHTVANWLNMTPDELEENKNKTVWTRYDITVFKREEPPITKSFTSPQERLYYIENNNFHEAITKDVEITVRYILQKLGTECGRQIYPDIWVDLLFQDYDGQRWVIPDVRFDNEAKRIKELGGTIIKLTRPMKDRGIKGSVLNHPSEKGISDQYIDHTIHNDGSKKKLQNNSIKILRHE